MMGFVGGGGGVVSVRRNVAPAMARPRVARALAGRGRVLMRAVESAEEISLTLDEQNQKMYSLDAKTGMKRELSLLEKEELLLDTMSALYHGRDTVISNEMLDMLREELSWEGSSVVMMNYEELSFFECAKAYAAGNPIISDEEYDNLKEKLRKDNSPLVIREGAKCSVVTQTCTTSLFNDRFRTLVLYSPAAVLFSLIWAFGAFELTPLRGYTPLVSFFTGVPFFFLGAYVLTSLVLKKPKILAGECPNCGADVRVFFGDIAGVSGYGETAEIKCGSCKEPLVVNREKQLAETLPKKIA